MKTPCKYFCYILTLFLGVLTTTGFAQEEPDLRKEIEALKKGQQQIQQQLDEIRELLQARTAPRTAGPNVEGVVFELGENPTKGADTAQLTLIEFTDYQCGFCARHSRDTAPILEQEYVETGKLRYALLDLPLAMHKLAFRAAEVAHCAGRQGKYWQMHDRLFANQQALEPWQGHAEAVGLDMSQFEECLSTRSEAGHIYEDMTMARKIGATGTPSFVLGRTDPEDPSKVIGIRFLRGAQPYPTFKEAIDQALANETKEESKEGR